MTLTANSAQQELPSNLSSEQVVLMTPSNFLHQTNSPHSQINQQQQHQYQQQQAQQQLSSPTHKQQSSQQQQQQSPMPPVPLPVQMGGNQNVPPNSQSGQFTVQQTPAGQYTQEQLWELVKGKEAVILIQQKKLVHYRAWMSTIHARVQQMNPNVIKNARRLYVGSLPEGYSDDDELKNFFSNLMTTKGGCTNPGNPILSCKITVEKQYAFLELRSVEETTNVMAFDGIAFKDCYLKIRRPSNYDVNSAVMLGPISPDPTVDSSNLDICRSVVEDSPNKLFVGGLPCDWSEDQVKELLTPQGNLRSFNLVMDKMTGKSKGYAFCEFDEGTTDFVIAALNQKKVGNKVLTVKRALEGNKGGIGEQIPSMPIPQQQQQGGSVGGSSGRNPSIGRMGSGMPSVASGAQPQFNSSGLAAASGQLQPNLMAAMMQNPGQLGGQQQQQQQQYGLATGDSGFSPSSSTRFNRNSAGNSSGRGGLEDAANAAIHQQVTDNHHPQPNMLQRNTNHAGLGSNGGSLPAGLSPNPMASANPYSMGIMNQPPFNNNPVW